MSNCNCGFDIGDPRMSRHSDSCVGLFVAKLQARNTELEAELEKLEQQLVEQARYHEVAIGTLRDSNDELEAELAELREALVKISKMDNIRVDYWNNEDLLDAVSVASAALLGEKE